MNEPQRNDGIVRMEQSESVADIACRQRRQRVQAWMLDNGPMPRDSEIEAAMQDLICEWLSCRITGHHDEARSAMYALIALATKARNE